MTQKQGEFLGWVFLVGVLLLVGVYVAVNIKAKINVCKVYYTELSLSDCFMSDTALPPRKTR